MKRLILCSFTLLFSFLFINAMNDNIRNVTIHVGKLHEAKTLNDAYELYQLYAKRTSHKFRYFTVLLHDSEYEGNSTLWNVDVPGVNIKEVKIKIIPATKGQKVTFNGKYTSEGGKVAHKRDFLRFRNRGSSPIKSNIFISDLIIQNYASGIYLGDYASSGQLTGNTIRFCEFINIGEMFPHHKLVIRGIDLSKSIYKGRSALNYTRQKGVVAIGVTRSSHNQFVGNKFVRNINHEISSSEKEAIKAIKAYYKSHVNNVSIKKQEEDIKKISATLKRYGPLLIHSIYITDHSKGNKVMYNNFSEVSGDAVRIRNYSNNTRVQFNQFNKPYLSNYRREYLKDYQQQLFAVSEWHCNNAISSCSAYEDEDYSYGTIVSKNLVSDYESSYAYRNEWFQDRGMQSSIAMCEVSGTCRKGLERRFRSYHNIESPKKGLCYMKFESSCLKMGIGNETKVILDYPSKDSHESEDICKRRVSSYKKYCEEPQSQISYIYREKG